MMQWREWIRCVLITVALGSGGLAWADNNASLSALVYKKLAESQAALKDKKLDASVAILQGVADHAENTTYDNAMIWHMLGYAYYEQGNLKKSAQAYEKVFEFDVPQGLATSNHKMLGQVYMALALYNEALPHLSRWLENEDSDREMVHALIAHCHYEIKQYKSAVVHIQTAIDGYRNQRKQPKESWLNLLQASLAQMDDVEGRIRTIKLLLSWFPKNEYWLALASCYAQLEKMDNYLAILSLAQRKDLLTTESQYVSLASVYFAQGAPQKATEVLEEGFKRKLVKRNIRNLRFLASAYSMAREYQAALTPLREAAAQSKDGELDVMLGNALYQLARWDEASKALATGLDKGDLKQATIAWLMLGQTLLNLKQYDGAITAFEQAALDEERANQAQQWLKYVRYEKERQAKLKLETDPS